MKVLHLLRDPGDPHAAAVIGAEVARGTAVGVLLLGPGVPPPLGAPVYALAEACEGVPEAVTRVGWDGALDLIFRAGTVVTW